MYTRALATPHNILLFQFDEMTTLFIIIAYNIEMFVMGSAFVCLRILWYLYGSDLADLQAIERSHGISNEALGFRYGIL